jgi:hypothetical protein
MLGGVLILGGIAASDMAAHEAHSEMNPRISRLQTVLTAIGAGLHFLDVLEVRTYFCRH